MIMEMVVETVDADAVDAVLFGTATIRSRGAGKSGGQCELWPFNGLSPNSAANRDLTRQAFICVCKDN